MKKIAIITDSNSGITQSFGKQLGISVIPMPFNFDDKTFLEDISLTQEEFYARLDAGANISTSQPSPEYVLDLWDKLLENHDEIVHMRYGNRARFRLQRKSTRCQQSAHFRNSKTIRA